MSPNYVEVRDNKRYAIGIEGAKEHIRGVRDTYPDLHLTAEQQIAEGEWVITRVTMRGTHLGEWQGIEPTGGSSISGGCCPGQTLSAGEAVAETVAVGG